MKKRTSIFDVIKNGCFIFTVITLFSYIVLGLITQTRKELNLNLVIILLAFSIVLAFANLLLKQTKLALGVRVVLHFSASTVLYFIVVVIGGGFISSGAQTMIALMFFLLFYALFAIIYITTSLKKSKKKNKETKYESMFK